MIDRKKFLELTVTGGLGAIFGSAAYPKNVKQKGATLEPVSRQTVAMGSIISFQVMAENEEAGYEAIRRGEKIFRDMENIFSMYDEGSEMAKLGKNSGKSPITVSDDAISVLEFAKNVYHRSKGKFDVTIEPAMKKWGFRNNPGKSVHTPTDSELKKLERLIGSNKIVIEQNGVLLQERGMAIDTGGIAGGYALDMAINEMKKCDISAAFINFSGDINCFGTPAEKDGWPVYILDPHSQQLLNDPVILKDEALSTSGAYQNRRHGSDEHSWGHLLDPIDAEPVEPVGSVTAIASSAMSADAWSTAAYIGAKVPDEVKTVVLK